jgi:Starch binding domain
MRIVSMKGVFTAAAALMAVACLTGSAFATIDWAGNVYPLDGSAHLPTGPITTYAQVYKSGVTDPAGQGADLSAVLYYTPEGGAQQSVAMTYLGDVGNNDEYTADIPQAALLGVSFVDVTVVFTDASDGSDFEVLGDQNGTPPPLRYNVTDATPNDVDVTFTLCMSGTATMGDPCVIGSAPEIGAWGTGVNMSLVSGELYEVTVTFAAGSNPNVEYKYKKDACIDWESVGNRAITLPTDGTTSVVLGPDSWNNAPIGCGLGSTLDAPKEVCFQVCLEAVQWTGGTCVIGSSNELTNWTTGVAMTEISPSLFEVCVTWPAGTPIQTIEYKFKKDDCNTWEGVANRTVLLDNSSPATQTVFHTFDDTAGTCAAVSVEPSTWGHLKGMYR